MVEALAARADSQLRRRLCGGDGGSCGSVRGAGPERRPRGGRRRRWRWAMTALHLPQGVATARAEAAAALVCLRHWRRLSRSISLLLLLILVSFPFFLQLNSPIIIVSQIANNNKTVSATLFFFQKYVIVPKGVCFGAWQQMRR